MNNIIIEGKTCLAWPIKGLVDKRIGGPYNSRLINLHRSTFDCIRLESGETVETSAGQSETKLQPNIRIAEHERDGLSNLLQRYSEQPRLTHSSQESWAPNKRRTRKRIDFFLTRPIRPQPMCIVFIVGRAPLRK
jgi:hypothetical protein